MTDIDFSSTEATASYGIGLQMGQQLSAIFEGVVLDAAIAGLKDAFQGKKAQIPIDEIHRAFDIIQANAQEQTGRRAEQLAAEGKNFLVENAKRKEVVVTESGLQYEVIVAGKGAIPNAQNVVRTHYCGTLINGKQFDSSYDRHEPTEFPVNGVIAGWTEALLKMTVGSKWKLYIPYQLAYGERGAGGDIGPFQTLIFDIELLDIVS